MAAGKSLPPPPDLVCPTFEEKLTRLQDIAPTYYDLATFPKGEVKTALQRTADKIKRKQAMKGGR